MKVVGEQSCRPLIDKAHTQEAEARHIGIGQPRGISPGKRRRSLSIVTIN